MIPFFRKIRKKMADDNKPLKYARYAIGEIVLVVIGILIALQINNRNEQHKSDAKIDVLFEKVLIELADNINDTQRMIGFYKHTNLICNLVSDNKLTYDDYVNPKLDKNGNLIVGLLYMVDLDYTTADFNMRSFENLILNMNAIPVKYDHIVSELTSMYTIDKKEIDISNKVLNNMYQDNQAELVQKYDWYSLRVPNNENKGMIDYMLNNYLYKNKMQYFSEESDYQLAMALKYRNRAIKIYQELAALLNKSKLHESFEVNPEVVRLLIGTYQFVETNSDYESKPGYLELIKFENNLLVTYQPRDSSVAWENTVLDFNKTKSKMSVSILRGTGVYMTYIVEGDTLTIKNLRDNYWKFLKIK